MATCQTRNRKFVDAVQDSKKPVINPEQKIAHVETLLRRLYAKVDEFETLCKEERQFYDELKRRGRKSVPKFDPQVLHKVVSGQQRCAEAAFNNLDAFKRNNRPSTSRKVTIDAPIKERERLQDEEMQMRAARNRQSWNYRGPGHQEKNPMHGLPSASSQQQEQASSKESWYGSLDRNMKKKKRGYLEKNRRHTKTVGSLAGLNVENIEMLQPDEQYTFGLPTLTTASDPATFHSQFRLPYSMTRLDNNTSIPAVRLPTHQEYQLQWQQQQLPRNHSYSRSQPVVMYPNHTSPETQGNHWQERSTASVTPPVQQPQYFENLKAPTQYVLSSKDSVDGFSPTASVTDVNFNRLTLSSPTENGELSSSRSSENEDTKGAFMNESSKPFEMADYYKYSTKFRTNKPALPAPTLEGSALQRMNGLINQTAETTSTGKLMQTNSYSDISAPEGSVPKLPPKLRPVVHDVPLMTMQSQGSFIGSENHDTQEPWVQVNPTIV